jgi:acetyl-CoA carboxylase carboxyltransferase component
MEAKERLAQIEEERKKLLLGGGPAKISEQHQQGKLTARERIERLLDPNSFSEFSLWETPIIPREGIQGDGVVTGHGKIDGRPLFVWAQDWTCFDGRAGIIHTWKIAKLIERALRTRAPCIGIYDSEGLRMEDFLAAPTNYSFDKIAYFQTQASGVIPQISLIMGPCVGSAAISAILADFTFMVRGTSYLNTSEHPEKPLDAWTYARHTGCCDVLTENDDDCLKRCHELFSFLPLNNERKPPQVATGDDPNRKEEELLEMVPVDKSKTYNMYRLISLIVDDGNFFEIKRYWAANLIVGFAHLGGQAVGIIASNPQSKGGCMDVDSADKMARFVRSCDAFNIPLIWLADTPAFLPAVGQERGAIIKHGAKMVNANSLATVPQITVYIRKCYGGGNLAMPGENLGGDITLAWPTTILAPMIPEGAVAIVYRKQLEAAENPEQEKTRLTDELVAASHGQLWKWMPIQEYIDPRETRPLLIKALELLSDKKEVRIWRKHDNAPL